MLKLRAFRLGNSFLLGLIGLLTGSVFVLSNGAHGDAFGSDCPPDWSVLSGGCDGIIVTRWTGSYSCATSPSGLCCTYKGFGVFCDVNDSETHMGYLYSLDKKGVSGKTCTPMGCW